MSYIKKYLVYARKLKIAPQIDKKKYISTIF